MAISFRTRARRGDSEGHLVVQQNLDDLANLLNPMLVKPTITGAKGGNAALADLLTKLAQLGLIVDSTT